MANQIFRDKALEQLSSPEQLDQLLTVVNRKSWIPLAALGGLMLAAAIWSFFGQIPVTVEGVGLLVHPRQVVSFQLPASGQVVELSVKVGDFVKKGQALGRINQPALQQSLDQVRVRLAELRERNSRLVPLRNERTDLEKQANEREQKVIEQRIQSTLRTAETQKAKNSVREALKQRLDENNEIDFATEGDRIRVLRVFRKLHQGRRTTDLSSSFREQPFRVVGAERCN